MNGIVTKTTRERIVRQTNEETVYVIEVNQEQFDKLASVLAWFHRTHTEDGFGPAIGSVVNFGPVIGSVVNKSSYRDYLHASSDTPKHSF